MKWSERPAGTTVAMCPHGVPEHVPCDRCATVDLDAPNPCEHGTIGDCSPCDRATDIGRGPRTVRLTRRTAHRTEPCRCGANILGGDTITRDPDDGAWVCDTCATRLGGVA